MLLAFAVGLAIPALRLETSWVARGEWHSVEIAAALTFLVAALVSFALVVRLRRGRAGSPVVASYALFGGLICSWDWRRLRGARRSSGSRHRTGSSRRTSKTRRRCTAWASSRATTSTCGPRSRWWRTVGVWLRFVPRFRTTGVPLVVLPFLLPILALSLADIIRGVNDTPNERLHLIFRDGSELMELWVRIAAALFVWLNRATIAPDGAASPHRSASHQASPDPRLSHHSKPIRDSATDSSQLPYPPGHVTTTSTTTATPVTKGQT
jgi:hypothetical protein